MTMQDELSILEQIVAKRRTTKVLAECDLPALQQKELIDRVLACAGWAPFHRVCGSLHRMSEQSCVEQLLGIEPWRFHVIDAENCRRLRALIIPMEAAGKIPAMLASAAAVAIATWLPNPPQSSNVPNNLSSGHPSESSFSGVNPNADPEYFEPTLENVEHIAAASAAVQSLLLAATAAGLHNYWSSGGVLRTPEVLLRLGIPVHQRVLGAVFLFPTELPEAPPVHIVGSKLRDARGGPAAWSRWISLLDE